MFRSRVSEQPYCDLAINCAVYSWLLLVVLVYTLLNEVTVVSELEPSPKVHKNSEAICVPSGDVLVNSIVPELQTLLSSTVKSASTSG